MQIDVSIVVKRDDGTTLTRTEHIGNDRGWVGTKPRRLTRSELRKIIDDRLEAALNAMGVRR